VTTVEEVRRAHGEGRAAVVGAGNPYVGRAALAAAWMHGYMLMLQHMLRESPARQAYLRAQRVTRLSAR